MSDSKRYRVTCTITAGYCEDVEADSPEEAEGQAWPSLCWQCSKNLELGDIYDEKAVLVDENGDPVSIAADSE